ncbi:MAG: chemotaxis protein CheW, partial [Rhodospirillales bacterium]|nr:chemotaxis protein CheW [Rhodospirillales bacterium]
MIGQETELDRQVLELIKDPLTHMVRNSADHGIEDPDTRQASGKPEMGKIVLNAYHEGGHIIIEIKDDGKGLPTDKIKKKILENKLASEEELAQMTTQQIHMFIFHAGFSTADKITSVSGRGVGMDVVRTNIEKIGGSIELKSVEGKGSTFKIKIPLTLAIVSALIIEAGGERFAIPQLSVRELVMASHDGQNKIEKIKGASVIRLRDRLLPLISLRDLLKLSDLVEASVSALAKEQNNEGEGDPTPQTSKGEFLINGQAEHSNQYIVVTQVGNYSFGIMVDRVYDTEEIVVKPVAKIIKNIDLFSGNTILGDGSVIMILDPNGIAKSTGEITTHDGDGQDVATADSRNSYAKEKTSLILFTTGDHAPKTVPLALVSRLEIIKTADLEYANGQMLIQYRGSLMPIVPFNTETDIHDKKECPVLVFMDNDRVMGLAVEEIIDIKEEVIDVQMDGTTPGIIGTAIINEKATDVVDVGYYIKALRSDWFQNHAEGDYDKPGSIHSDNDTNSLRKKILLVDDSPFFRNMLTPILSMAGYHVTTMDNAKQALKRCEAGEKFDLIISDIEMPEMDGFEFVEALKKNEDWENIPVLALSSHTTDRDRQRGREAGFFNHLAKFDRDNILQTLNQTFAQLKEAS